MKDSRRISNKAAASIDEITEAINGLTRADLARLKSAAQYRVRGLGRAAEGRTWKDLVNETILAFYRPDGRRWKKNEVDIVRTLTEAMRSVASNWKRKFDDHPDVSLESEVTINRVDKTTPYPIEQARSWRPTAEREFEYKEMLEKIDSLMAERERAALIVMGLKGEMSPAEIRDVLGITENEYETEMRWIRRKVRTAFPNGRS